jgi:hypothetical protein
VADRKKFDLSQQGQQKQISEYRSWEFLFLIYFSKHFEINLDMIVH